MRKFKKLLAVLIAFVMAFAVFALSANTCGSDKPDNNTNIQNPDDKDPVDPKPDPDPTPDPKPDPDPDPTPDPKPDPDPDPTPDPKPDPDPDPTPDPKPDPDPDPTPDPKPDPDPVDPKPTVTKAEIISNALKNKKNYAEVHGTATQTTTFKNFALNADGTKGDKKSTFVRYEVTEKIDGKTNINVGDMDGQWYETVKDNEQNETFNSDLTLYLRNYEGLTDTSDDNELYYNQGAADMFIDVLYYYLHLVLPDTILRDEINEFISLLFERTLTSEHYVVLKLADTFNALEIENGKAIVNVNKLAYNLAVEVKAYFVTIDVATTTGEILKNETVKKILTSFTDVLTADEMRNILADLYELYGVAEILESENIVIEVNDILVETNKDEDAYSYLFRAVSSTKAKEAFNKIYKGLYDPSFSGSPVTLDKLPINYILVLLGENEGSFISFRNEVLGYVTKALETSNENKFYYSDDYSGVLVENAKIEFALDGAKITSQKISADATVTFGSTTEDGWLDVDEAFSAELTLIYSDETFVLENIDDKLVVKPDYEWVENTYDYSLYLTDDSRYINYESVELKVKSKVENKEIVGFEIYLSDGTKVTVTDVDPETGELSHFNIKVNAVSTATGEKGEFDITIHVALVADEGSVCFYKDESIGYENICYFQKEQVIYENTVKGMLNGDPFYPKKN